MLREETGVVYRILMSIPKGKRPLGRTRHRWKNYINMDLQGVECGSMG